MHRHAPTICGSREHLRQAIPSPMSNHDCEDVGHSGSTVTPSPIHFEKGPSTLSNHIALASAQQKTRPRNSNHSIPRGFENLLHQDSGLSAPSPGRESQQKEYCLHVRQQPTAARACGAGVRGRRPVDPPPIVQILLSDFDSESSNDRDVLKDPQFTVGCLLLPVSDSSSGLQDPEFEKCQQTERNKGSDGVARADDAFFTPLLSGKTFVSPFYVNVDLDSNSAPTHPSRRDSKPENCSYSGTGNLHNESELQQPATFFIFDDLSIRFAEIYRLKFRLMNWGSIEDKAQTIPILAEAWSDPFLVCPAREFPGMSDSSSLVCGLKELGYVELQIRGKDKGKGRKKQ
ncbi:Velvet factor [Penicillium brevicompactum]